MKAMIVAGMNRLCFVNSCKISHLGIKPERGGNPPKERRVIRAITDSSGDLVDDEEMELIFIELKILNKRKVVSVIIIYRIRFSRVKLGA